MRRQALIWEVGSLFSSSCVRIYESVVDVGDTVVEVRRRALEEIGSLFMHQVFMNALKGQGASLLRCGGRSNGK